MNDYEGVNKWLVVTEQRDFVEPFVFDSTANTEEEAQKRAAALAQEGFKAFVFRMTEAFWPSFTSVRVA